MKNMLVVIALMFVCSAAAFAGEPSRAFPQLAIERTHSRSALVY
jgi:hypothetical protein